MLAIYMAEEAFGTETFDMAWMEVIWEAHDAKELGVVVFHIEELVWQDSVGME